MDNRRLAVSECVVIILQGRIKDSSTPLTDVFFILETFPPLKCQRLKSAAGNRQR